MSKKWKFILMLTLYALVGGGVGYFFGKGSIAVPVLEPDLSIYFEYDTVYGVIAFILVVLIIWTLIGWVKIRNVQPNRSDEEAFDQSVFNKMDEGEKWIVYRSAYRAFKCMDVVMLVGIGFSVLYSAFSLRSKSTEMG
jgi:hypothetical protein